MVHCSQIHTHTQDYREDEFSLMLTVLILFQSSTEIEWYIECQWPEEIVMQQWLNIRRVEGDMLRINEPFFRRRRWVHFNVPFFNQPSNNKNCIVQSCHAMSISTGFQLSYFSPTAIGKWCNDFRLKFSGNTSPWRTSNYNVWQIIDVLAASTKQNNRIIQRHHGIRVNSEVLQ